MHQSRSFSCPSQRYEKLLSAIQDWLVGEKFECQRLKTEDGGQLLQIQKNGRLAEDYRHVDGAQHSVQASGKYGERRDWRGQMD